MSIHRTVTATCDAKVTDKGHEVPCESKVDLDPDDPQVWLALVSAGWAVAHLAPLTESGNIPTYCPDHAKGAFQ